MYSINRDDDSEVGTRDLIQNCHELNAVLDHVIGHQVIRRGETIPHPEGWAVY